MQGFVRAGSHPRRHVVAAAIAVACTGTAGAQTAPSPEPGASAPAPVAEGVARLPTVEVVGTTPIPGVGQPRDRIPSNVQTINLRRMQELDALNLPELMGRSLGSVSVVELQGNPYQVEVNFRGFSASPLLGTPQGLSVFVDGTRVNEPFGDIVNWDLIPRNALRSLTVMPGSNPVFGLNTLGGALVLTTKNGRDDPGTEAELTVGAWSRVGLEASHGVKLGDGGHLFLAGSSTREDGWRDESPSRVDQFFGKYGRASGPLSWDLGLTLAKNRMVGNGALPDTLLAQDYEQVYTIPDETRNTLTMLSLNGEYRLNDTDKISATATVRFVDTDTLNGDINDDFDPPTVEETGVENRTSTGQHVQSLAVQWSRTLPTNQLILGASFDNASTEFEQTEAEGELDANRRVTATEEPEVNAKIDGDSRTISLYAADMWSPRPDLHLSFAGRYNQTHVTTVDEGRLLLGLDTELDNDLTFRKFNPAAGITWQASPALTAYGSLSQGNRAPSPIELGCSDPEDACVLPNALQSDPPLKQVVSRTFEAGLRGQLGGGVRWNASLFRTQNKDDILFVSNSLAAGFFTNFGETRRQGLELGASGRFRAIDWGVSYSHVRATFETAACLVAESNSTAETSAACTGDDEIEVLPGDRLPGIPEHSLKLDAGWRVQPGLRIGASVVAQSSVFVRGNENNRHAADGVEYFGDGKVAGFGILNLNGAWNFARGWTLTAKIINVLDRKYGTGGLLAENSFSADGTLQEPDDWVNERFVAPGAPRAGWIGVRYSFGGE